MPNRSKDVDIKGISVCNPVDPEKGYLLFTVDYAIRNQFNHLQVIGPIHNGVKGNIDGMTLYQKYSRFNGEKDLAYIRRTMEAVNLACQKASGHGLKMYQWHHELELPAGFTEVYPETGNASGDIEVTHPLVKDFLENKIRDFFEAYPLMDGIILTLHETKVPLLKLKDQKLGKTERVQYVTKILFDTCKSLGKELVVRPFASTQEDYERMAGAYKSISGDLLFMDKWTQFDWSLTLPHNAFFAGIENPLLIEADIFGEFFGKGHLPLMLRNHIAEKMKYCSQFSPKGYVARIDRAGQHPFGSVNEVNLCIMNAYLQGEDAGKAIEDFFARKYPGAAREVRELMEDTEEILRKTIYTKGYYFSELSRFPTLNHCKNHFYFEMMRKDYAIVSEEWFIPKDWNRGTLQSILEEKESAVEKAEELYEKLLLLKGKISEAEYEKLWKKFANLKFVTAIWKRLTMTFMDYAAYFEKGEERYEAALEEDLTQLCSLRDQGTEVLGADFYCSIGGGETGSTGESLHFDYIGLFAEEIRKSFRAEKEETMRFQKDPHVLDYVICGGAMEGHKLKKEVNFSDTLIKNGRLCRIPGNQKGMEWSSINAHGWFSYELCILPECRNEIVFSMGNADGILEAKITIGTQEFRIQEKTREARITIPYFSGKEKVVRVRVDKISRYTPCIYTIEVSK